MIRWPKIAILVVFLIAGRQGFGQEVDAVNPAPGISERSRPIIYTAITNLPDWKRIYTPKEDKISKTWILPGTSLISTRYATPLPSFSEPRSFVCDLEDFLSERTKLLIDIGPE